MLTLFGFPREFVEREVTDFARRNPGVVIYVNPRPCCVPRVVAEYREWGRARVGGRYRGVRPARMQFVSPLTRFLLPHLPSAS